MMRVRTQVALVCVVLAVLLSGCLPRATCPDSAPTAVARHFGMHLNLACHRSWQGS